MKKYKYITIPITEVGLEEIREIPDQKNLTEKLLEDYDFQRNKEKLLTEKERKFADMLEQGFNIREIAELLEIGYYTARETYRRIKRKYLPEALNRHLITQ